MQRVINVDMLTGLDYGISHNVLYKSFFNGPVRRACLIRLFPHRLQPLQYLMIQLFYRHPSDLVRR